MYTYSMSKAGNCARTLSAERLGMLAGDKGSPPEFLRIAAREGTRHEQFIREDLPEHGWESILLKSGGSPECKVCGRFGIHTEFTFKDILFVGHMDDLVVPAGSLIDLHIGEYKALGRFMYATLDKYGPENHRTYATQLSLYMESKGLPAVWVLKNRDTGFMKVTKVEDQSTYIDEIADRLLMVEDYVERGELAPCDYPDGNLDKWSCSGLCESIAEKSATNPILPSDVAQAIKDWRTGSEMKETAEQLITDSRKLFEAYMDVAGLKRLNVNGLKILQVADGFRDTFNIPDEVKEQYKIKIARPGYIRITDEGVE